MVNVTNHAIQRYQQRVRSCSDDEARKALTSPAVQIAASFGAPYVRLCMGQRVIINDHSVVTVLPDTTRIRQVAWWGYD